MAKRAIKRIDFHNPTTNPIVFMQGTSPNDYPEEIEVLPGETYKGYANYYKFYKRNGLKVGASPTAGKMREDAARVSSDAARILASAEEAKLAALEAKREAEAARADAEVAIAEANQARAAAAVATGTDAPALKLPEQVDEDESQYPEVVADEDDDGGPLAPVDDLPVDPKIAKAKAAKAKAKAKAK